MKFILGTIAVILALSLAAFLLPAIIGVLIGISMISGGNILGGIIAIIIGILINIGMIAGGFLEGGGSSLSHLDDECPYCGSGDTDGNHCYTCDDDF